MSAIQVSRIDKKYSVNGKRILGYYADIWCESLDLHKRVSAPEYDVLKRKIELLISQWEKKLQTVSGKDAADAATIEATEKLESLSNILNATLSVDHIISWDRLKDKTRPPIKPVMQKIMPPVYNPPKFSFWDKIFRQRERKLRQAEEEHRQAVADYEKRKIHAECTYREQVKNWEKKKAEFLEKQAENNAKIDNLAAAVEAGEKQAIIDYVAMVLEKSDYNDFFEKSFELDYDAEAKRIGVEYELPSPENMPTLKSVRFIPSTGEMKEAYISERERKTNYDSVCYQICLRTLYELSQGDEYGNIQKVLFNGFASYIDPNTGHQVRSCIMSLLADKEAIEKIDFSRVDPKKCFKSLKGVSAAQLADLAPIPPVINLDKTDKRFIEAKDTLNMVQDSTNIASMHWGDFEHLVREVFGKEFASRGGEVKITQSSHDGGVDAVAFDPDPITGGKIIIQAKRYTRTVGVNAVRDLFGTMQHEGASRGILITTADFGSDAYEFASGKPITLMTGGNLLHLLEKHGYNAKIDLKAARKELGLRALGASAHPE